MEGQSPYLFIHIGLLIRLLRHATSFSVATIVGQGETLAQNLKEADFAVSSAGLQNLNEFLDDLKSSDNQSRIIGTEEVTRLSNIMHIIEQMVYAEAKTKKIYVLSESRFSLDTLMNKPWQMFGKKVFARLPPIAIYDVMEGFMCIILSRATAAAFHLLRASEATLRAYYLQMVKRGRVKQLLWGNMVQHLRKRRNKDEKLLQRLDYIRINYRNPTSHPDARYDLEQAQDLLGLCIEVITAMGKSLPERKRLF